MLLGSFFAGELCYADDLTILTSLDALQKMLQICETFADSHHICFNGDKTQLICFFFSQGFWVVVPTIVSSSVVNNRIWKNQLFMLVLT